MCYTTSHTGGFLFYNKIMTNVKIDIKKIAKLAELPIDEEKLGKLEKELETTVEHVERLENINTSHVSGTNTVTDLTNVVRDDVVESSLTQEEALKNAKKTHNGFFVVPVIIEEAVEV